MQSNKLDENILQVEAQLFDKVASHVDRLFKQTWLPSHDLQHHIRVWNFAKELILLHAKEGVDFSKDFIEALFIASLFHDTGLTKTFDISHGKISADLAFDFIEKDKELIHLLKLPVLEAIEKHDDKTYSSVENDTYISLYSILTVADDLDALGALGLYRYFEIYFLRGVKIEEVKNAIEKNIDSRFNFIIEQIKFSSNYLNKQRQRYITSKSLLEKISLSEIRYLNNGFKQKTSGNHELLDKQLISDSLSSFLSLVNTENKV